MQHIITVWIEHRKAPDIIRWITRLKIQAIECSRDLEKGMNALGKLVKKSHGRDEIDFTDFF